MGRKWLGILIMMLVAVLIAGCGSTNDTQELADYKKNVDPENIIETDIGTLYIAYKKNDFEITAESGPIEFMITGVQVADLDEADEQKGLFGKGNDATIVTVSVASKNTSNQDVSFYPNKSVLTTNAGDEVEGDMFFSDVVGGAYEAGVGAAGDVIYIIDSDARDITELHLTYDGPTDEENNSVGDAFELTIDLK